MNKLRLYSWKLLWGHIFLFELSFTANYINTMLRVKKLTIGCSWLVIIGWPFGAIPICCIKAFFNAKWLRPFINNWSFRCCGGWKYLHGGFSRLHRPCGWRGEIHMKCYNFWNIEKGRKQFIVYNSFSLHEELKIESDSDTLCDVLQRM